MNPENIYNEGRVKRRWLDAIQAEKKVTPKSTKALFEFVEYMEVQGLSVHRQNFYLNLLKQIAMVMGKFFTKPTRKNIEDALREIDKRRVNGKPIAYWTKMNYRSAMKRFYKWYLGNDELYPPEVAWIKTKNKGAHNKIPDDLITPRELSALLEACRHARDRALISLLADSGCGAGGMDTW